MPGGRGGGCKPGEKAGGRKKGTPNRSTGKAQEALAAFVDANIPKFSKWLDEIYRADGPKAAFGCVESVIEYHVPKLARTEHGIAPGVQKAKITFDISGNGDDA